MSGENSTCSWPYKGWAINPHSTYICCTSIIYGFLEPDSRISFYKKKRPQPAAHEVFEIHARYEQDLLTYVYCSYYCYNNKALYKALIFHKL